MIAGFAAAARMRQFEVYAIEISKREISRRRHSMQLRWL
jgi:hypothetical protein